MDQLVTNVISWADDKGILAKSSPLKQHVKTQEEVTELLEALVDHDRDEIIDAIGDIIVTLIIQAELNGLSVKDCLESAYNVISKRQGRMVNGLFVKD
jgi:NTP pyrophosphatase (non-canonical NTP hydrolase)